MQFSKLDPLSQGDRLGGLPSTEAKSMRVNLNDLNQEKEFLPSMNLGRQSNNQSALQNHWPDSGSLYKPVSK